MKNGLKFGEATLTIRVETLETAVPADTVTEKRFKEYVNVVEKNFVTTFDEFGKHKAALAS